LFFNTGHAAPVIGPQIYGSDGRKVYEPIRGIQLSPQFAVKSQIDFILQNRLLIQENAWRAQSVERLTH
jgi:hypothetical protein